MMEKIFKNIYLCFKALGYAKTASTLARNGKYKEAQEMMRRYGECK
jgi:hypothetical protein